MVERPRAALRRPAIAHYLSIAGATVFWGVLDRHLWFFGDEWDFLVHRGLWYGPTNPKSIWFPHEEHWSTLPILVWRALYNVFHLSSYFPYLVPLFVANAVVMHMAWRLSIRAGARPWLATAAVTLFGFAGAGAENMSWAFQVGFVGSLAFGLTALWALGPPVVAPAGQMSPTAGYQATNGLGPEPAAWRVWAPAGLLVASLMCSTVGNAMVVAAAFNVFCRYPARTALKVLGPPVGAYSLWWLTVGHLGLAAVGDHIDGATVTGLPAYIWEGLTASLGLWSNDQAAGVAIALVMAAWLAWYWPQTWRTAPELAGLAAAAVTFYALAGLGRDTLGRSVTPSRYVYVVIALATPIAAVAASRLSWAPARATCLAAVGFTAIGQVGQAQSFVGAREAMTQGLEAQTYASASLVGHGLHDVLGPGTAPVPYSPDLTVAALGDLWRAGALSHPPPSVTPAVLASTAETISLYTAPGPITLDQFRLVNANDAVVSPTGAGCRTIFPKTPALPASLAFVISPAARDASMHVRAPGNTAGATLTAFLVPTKGNAVAGLQPEIFAVPSGGEWLSDNAAKDTLVLDWSGASPLSLCNLQTGATPSGRPQA